MDPKGTDGTSSISSPWSRFTMSNLKLAVEIFDGTGHFGMWQGEVLDSLFQQGLDIAIEEKRPEDVGDKDWSRVNRLACGTIRSCLSREQKYAFKNETSAHKLWKALEDKFLKKSGQNKLLMKKRLFRFDYQRGNTMNEHITMFNQLVADLLNLDVIFEDEDLALMLLSSLPDEFEHLETTLLHGKENVSLDAVCSALYSHELRKQDKLKTKSAIEEALVTRGRDQSKSNWRRGMSESRGVAKDECAFCHEKGHWKKDCPKLKKKEKIPQDANDAENNVVEEAYISLLVSPTTSSHPDEWILDSGCTYHMCPIREWFIEFQELDGGVVYMGNDNSCKTFGIGSIKLQNHDGSIRILRDVRYVPELKKNLISLGALEAKGLVVIMRDGVLKVTSGVLEIIRGVRRNNLYYYQGSIVVESVTVGTSSTKEDVEVTQLWDMRLEHFGVRSLQNLVKQGLLKCSKTWKLEFCMNGVSEKTPLWNEMSEHMNKTFVEKVCRMLSCVGLKFWAETLTFVQHLVNCLSSSVIDGKTPLELNPEGVSSTLEQVECTSKQVQCTSKQVEFEQTLVVLVYSTTNEEEILTQESLQQSELIAVRMMKREIHKPARFIDMVAYVVPIVNLGELHESNMAIRCKWGFAKKVGFPDEGDVCYKAKLVAIRYVWKEKIGYNKISSPVVKHFSVRNWFALVAQLNLELAQQDVKTALIHGNLKEEIYMTQPNGYEIAGMEIWIKFEHGLNLVSILHV